MTQITYNEIKNYPAKAENIEESYVDVGRVVASKNGSKYHLPECSGAKRIKEENMVWYASVSEARQAGLSPAKNCPGI